MRGCPPRSCDRRAAMRRWCSRQRARANGSSPAARSACTCKGWWRSWLSASMRRITSARLGQRSVRARQRMAPSPATKATSSAIRSQKGAAANRPNQESVRKPATSAASPISTGHARSRSSEATALARARNGPRAAVGEGETGSTIAPLSGKGGRRHRADDRRRQELAGGPRSRLPRETHRLRATPERNADRPAHQPLVRDNLTVSMAKTRPSRRRERASGPARPRAATNASAFGTGRRGSTRKRRPAHRDPSEPVRHAVERDDLVHAHARPDHGVAVVLHQHFGHERAGVVGAGLNRAVSAGRGDGDEIAWLQAGSERSLAMKSPLSQTGPTTSTVT